jgi:hypothetical protein
MQLDVHLHSALASHDNEVIFIKSVIGVYSHEKANKFARTLLVAVRRGANTVFLFPLAATPHCTHPVPQHSMQLAALKWRHVTRIQIATSQDALTPELHDLCR